MSHHLIRTIVCLALVLGGCNEDDDAGDDDAGDDDTTPALVEGEWVAHGATTWEGRSILHAASGTSSWIFQEGGLAQMRTGDEWTFALAPSVDEVVATTVEQDGTVVVATAGQDLFRWNGSSWDELATDIGLEPTVIASDGINWYAASGHDLLVGGDGVPVEVELAKDVVDLWVPAPGEVWAATPYTYTITRVDTDGSTSTVADINATRICGTGPADAWAFEEGDPPWHFDGKSWTSFDMGTKHNVDYPHVWCSAEGEAWIVHNTHKPSAYRIWHLSDGQATETAISFSLDVLRSYGSVGPASSAFLVHTEAQLSRFDGNTLTDESGDDYFDLNLELDPEELPWDGPKGVRSTAVVDGELWAALGEGWSRYDAGAWTPLELPDGTFLVTGTADDLWAAAAGGNLYRGELGALTQLGVFIDEWALWAAGDWVFVGVAEGPSCDVYAVHSNELNMDMVDIPQARHKSGHCLEVEKTHQIGVAGNGATDVWGFCECWSFHWDGEYWASAPTKHIEQSQAVVIDDTLFVPSVTDEAERRDAWANEATREALDRAVHEGLIWALESDATTRVQTGDEALSFPLPSGHYAEIVSTGETLWAIGDHGLLAEWLPAGAD